MPEYSHNEKLFAFACAMATTTRHTEQLWEWVDNRAASIVSDGHEDPESYWDIMLAVVPWAFADAMDSNTIIRTKKKRGL